MSEDDLSEFLMSKKEKKEKEKALIKSVLRQEAKKSYLKQRLKLPKFSIKHKRLTIRIKPTLKRNLYLGR